LLINYDTREVQVKHVLQGTPGIQYSRTIS